MTTTTIRTLRDELASTLQNISGVWGVGVGREKDHYILVVSIDPPNFKGQLPKEYKGVPVQTADLSDAKLHLRPQGGSRRDARTN